MGSPTLTPNIGLQIPGFNTPNWNVPFNYNWQLIDSILGGESSAPGVITVGNLIATLASLFVSEQCAGAQPGLIFTTTKPPAIMLGLFWNGVLQRPSADYSIAGNTITTNFEVNFGDSLYAVYLFV
jgi:hypothetical protein